MTIMRLQFNGGSRDGVVMDLDWEEDGRALCERHLGQYYVWGASCPVDDNELEAELYVEGCPRAQPDGIPPVSLTLWYVDGADDELIDRFVVME